MATRRGSASLVVQLAWLLALLPASPLPGRAADWDAAQFQRHGGSYAAACQRPDALRLQIGARSLVAEYAGRRIEARITDAAVSYFGQSPPPGFQAALLTDLPAGRELSVIVMRDTAGRYLQLQADDQTLADLGLRPNDRSLYRDCDSARRSAEGAAERRQRQQDAADAKVAAAAHPLADPAFAQAYRRTFGPRLGQRWLARMDGPQPLPETVQVAGRRYRLHAVCKPHDCGDNNMVFLYGVDSGSASYALLREGGSRQVLLGAPPPAVAAELRRLWRATWGP